MQGNIFLDTPRLASPLPSPAARVLARPVVILARLIVVPTRLIVVPARLIVVPTRLIVIPTRLIVVPAGDIFVTLRVVDRPRQEIVIDNGKRAVPNRVF
ncbi:MAG: hypothetical protein LBF09_00425 [Odoribacteraceae bacterium]|nr:hypothetical protein [Odoribacteraceae bacterium]